jgi:hypothetical protein
VGWTWGWEAGMNGRGEGGRETWRGGMGGWVLVSYPLGQWF